MSDSAVNLLGDPSDKLRVAVEGCGHGTLDAIYTSVAKSCQEKGWSGVDLLIIGGDFQAVRNAHDLNVTAMPHKYRRMADFHKYYSGQRKAPYLTLFVGGNHEASNHLFELYYGGWVAPNIYYLGAANVLNVGPLRIAGLSGIFKGYDYRKAHFERLPYNQEDLTTIFHVRELDVRKLLALRSQVDIGLSHDWPQGVVWKGNYRPLFRKKRGFEEDANSHKLGSEPARYCLERLRPPYWFSAHLHTKYTAIIDHEAPAAPAPAAAPEPALEQQHHSFKPARRPEHQAQVSAWQSFQAKDESAAAAKADAVDRPKPTFTVQETFKQVVTDDDNLQRTVDTVEKSEWTNSDAHQPIAQLDGCSFSVSKKRSREATKSPEGPPAPVHSLANNQVDGLAPARAPAEAMVSNPDAIDIDMSSDDNEDPRPGSAASTRPTIAVYAGAPITVSFPQSSAPQEPNSSVAAAEEASQGGGAATATENGARPLADVDTARQAEGQQPLDGDIAEDLRAELASMSKSFADGRVETSAALPFPEHITNKSTQFLALDKCEPDREFIQLLEIGSITSDRAVERPVKLEYDAEWLAILRAFADELELGGKPSDRAPAHRGDTLYDARITEEKKWVREKIVSLQVPDNFTLTAPVYEAELKVDSGEMPQEYPNPQTATFCALIGIENKFALGEQERAARIAAGPREERDWYRGGEGRRGSRAGGRGGRGRGRGGRGGRGRGGRGHGRW